MSFVKNKIKSNKKVGSVARARKEHWPTSLAKVIKKAAQIADLMTGEDVEEDLRVLREAKHATHHIYDTKLQRLVPVPDHKTRLAATTLSRAYHEGKPIERSITAHGDFDDVAEMQRRLKGSPEAERLGLTDSLQKTVPETPRIVGDVRDVDSLQSGQNVTNQEGPIQGGSGENEPCPSAEK